MAFCIILSCTRLIKAPKKTSLRDEPAEETQGLTRCNTNDAICNNFFVAVQEDTPCTRPQYSKSSEAFASLELVVLPSGLFSVSEPSITKHWKSLQNTLSVEVNRGPGPKCTQKCQKCQVCFATVKCELDWMTPDHFQGYGKKTTKKLHLYQVNLVLSH